MGVAEGHVGCGVERPLGVEAREGAQARSATHVGVDEVRPRRRQLQQAQRVPGRSGVEDDVIKSRGHLGIAEELRELVEGRDLDGAGARKLLLHAGDRRRREHPPIGTDHPLPIVVGGLFGVDVERRQSGHRRHRRRLRGQTYAKDLIQVGGRIGAHQQDPKAPVGQADRRRASRRSLPDATLAREEEDSGWVLDQGRHGELLQQQPDLSEEESLAVAGPQHPVDAVLGASSKEPRPAQAASWARLGYTPLLLT